jgi:hypothetical protein
MKARVPDHRHRGCGGLGWGFFLLVLSAPGIHVA